MLGHRRAELDDLGLRLVLGSGGLLALLAQEAEVDEVRFDFGRWLFRVVGWWIRGMTTRQR